MWAAVQLFVLPSVPGSLARKQLASHLDVYCLELGPSTAAASDLGHCLRALHA